MNLFMSERGGGKTRYLIEQSAKTGIPIVCNRPENVMAKAKEWGFDIPNPISYYEAYSGVFPELHGKQVYIDELNWFLMAMGLDVKCATIDLNWLKERRCENEDIRPW